MHEMDKEIRVYQCEDSAYGVLSAVYEAGISGYGHDYIRIEISNPEMPADFSLFSHYITVDTSFEKAESVMKAVRRKISTQAFRYMMNAAVSDFADRGDVIYQFVTYGFTMGDKVCYALQLPFVARIFEIDRAVVNVAHYSREFLRFKQVRKTPSLLFAVYEPKHGVTSLIADHFADRFPEENFVIYDKKRREAAIHKPGASWFLWRLTPQEALQFDHLDELEEEYVDLWKVFFHTIAIEERHNSCLQRQHMPLHYRKHVTEWN